METSAKSQSRTKGKQSARPFLSAQQTEEELRRRCSGSFGDALSCLSDHDTTPLHSTSPSAHVSHHISSSSDSKSPTPPLLIRKESSRASKQPADSIFKAANNGITHSEQNGSILAARSAEQPAERKIANTPKDVSVITSKHVPEEKERGSTKTVISSQDSEHGISIEKPKRVPSRKSVVELERGTERSRSDRGKEREIEQEAEREIERVTEWRRTERAPDQEVERRTERTRSDQGRERESLERGTTERAERSRSDRGMERVVTLPPSRASVKEEITLELEKPMRVHKISTETAETAEFPKSKSRKHSFKKKSQRNSRTSHSPDRKHSETSLNSTEAVSNPLHSRQTYHTEAVTASLASTPATQEQKRNRTRECCVPGLEHTMCPTM